MAIHELILIVFAAACESGVDEKVPIMVLTPDRVKGEMYQIAADIVIFVDGEAGIFSESFCL